MVDLRHHRRDLTLDHAELRAVLPAGVAAVAPVDAPIRNPDEQLQDWRERIAADYMARRIATLEHHHGEV